MKKYKITVNGQTYEVEVEEIGSAEPIYDAINISTQEKPKEPPKREVSKPSQAAPASKKAPSAGKISIAAPMPGTILSVKVKEGSKVSKGDVIMILEAMKMENEILAPQDGTISSIAISEGASVNTGDLLATME
ncbi:MAG: biotin/lipoyl-binding protein [Tepidanaerobacteraceae bacterium]|nr:biotin/lipoyl-binding protein [Tepidanaerobacteraceae bacterium]